MSTNICTHANMPSDPGLSCTYTQNCPLFTPIQGEIIEVEIAGHQEGSLILFNEKCIEKNIPAGKELEPLDSLSYAL